MSEYDADLIQGRVISLDSKDVNAFSTIVEALNSLKIKYCVVFSQKWIDNIAGCWNEETVNWAGLNAEGISAEAQLKDGIFINVAEWIGQDEYEQMQP